MSRSRSAESLSSDSTSKAAKEDVLAKLAKWQAEDKRRAQKQAEKALLDFQYCVGNVCYQAVGDFCEAHKLSPAEGSELMKFIRYAKEKGLVTPETAQAASKRDVNTLCKVWAEKRL